MVYFCEKCSKTHQSDEMCPHIREQIRKNPELLNGASTFANVAGQYHLVTSQSLDVVAQKVNDIFGSNLRFEGTHQFARDIQVFDRLNVEAFCKAGYFRSPEAAKIYLENATQGQLNGLKAKIVGSGGEVDWLRGKQGELRSVIQKSSLLNKNAPGVDGEVVNRFTEEQITRVSVKAASTQGGVNTGSQGIIKSLKSETIFPDETVFVTEGGKKHLLEKLSKEIAYAEEVGDKKFAELLKCAKDNLKIVEGKDVAKNAADKERILDKIKDGRANTNVTMNEALGKAAQGAVIGAAISVTVSSVTNYIRYRNGEITCDEAFVNVGQDTTKGALIGGAMGAITIFLPVGAVGFVAGFAIGMYLNATLTNVLDEIFGKGAYREILVASGCVMGTSMNLAEAMRVFADDRIRVRATTQRIDNKLSDIGKKMEVL